MNTDTTPPDTSITSSPAAVTNSTSAIFSFTSTEAGSTFGCSLDGSAFTACTSPQSYSSLTSGSHTFQVRATDAANNTDQTPASFTWTIDITPPDTTITSAPPATTNSTSASFSFTSTEAGSTFACSLDGAGFTACASPQNYTGLAVSSHNFQVRAIDAAGNFDTTPASHTWTINAADTTPPETTITSGPPATTNSTSASFSFTSTEAGSTFECSLDGAAFTACASPQNYTSLAVGNHNFQVRAIDAAGNVDTTPASYTWTINALDTTPPVLTNFVVNTPIVATGTGPATFRATLTAQDDQSGVERAGLSIQSSNGSRHISNCARVGGTPPSATFECTLNLPQFSAAGAWIIDLSVTDAAGNGPHVYTSTELASLGFDSTFIVSAQPPNTIPAQLPAGLVSWWDGDFVSGATVLDLGSGINGALVNGATVVAGKVGNAFSFDGIDDFVQVPDSDLWTFGSNDFSIHLWANFSTVDTGSRDQLRNVFVGHDGAQPPFFTVNKWIFFYAENGLFFHIFDTTEGVPIFLGPFAFTPVVGQFHHFAVTRSGNTYTFYADGAAIGSTIDSRPIPNATAPLTIGQSEGAGFFHGLIDEVQIYNRALSQAEIQIIFLADSAGVSKVRNRIYWSEDDKLRTANVEILPGQTPSNRTDIKNLLVGQPTCCGRDLVLDEAGGKMYWTNTDSFTFGIRRSGIDIPAGQTASNRTDVEFLVPGQMFGMTLDLAGSKMYWTQTFNGNVRRSNLNIPAGQNANNRTDIEDLVVGESINRRGIALDRVAGKIYFVDGDGGRIQRANLDGSNLEHLVTGLGSYDPVALDLDLAGGKIYFTRGSFGGPIKIQRANLNGSNVEDVVILTAPPLGIALDVPGGKIYWGTGGGGGTDKIQRANLDGSNIEDLVTGLNGVSGMALGFTPLPANLDTIPPDTSITSNPPATTNSTSAAFQFTSDDAAATFECKLDSESFAACTSPKNYTGLTNGSHTFQVRAVDAAGNFDTTPASYTWTVTVDTTIPTVLSIVRSSINPTNSFSVSWTVTFSENVSGVDASDFNLATTGLTGASIFSIPAGPGSVYTVTVLTGSGSGTLGLNLVDNDSIVDGTNNPLGGAGVGNGNFTGEVFVIDKTAPDTSISVNPPSTTNSTTASFEFTSTEANSNFACSLDGAPFTGCTSPTTYNGLASGSHTFRVAATDQAGNTDSTPASYTWTITTADITPPETTITGNPPAVTSSTSASFTFTSNEAGSTFQCRLDAAAFAACTSPRNFTGLAAGSHTFQVRATDTANNTDPSPASFTWVIDRTDPDTSITSNPTSSNQ